MQCSNNLKQLGLALHSYHAALGSFPAGALWSKNAGGVVIPGTGSRINFHVQLFPYVEQSNAYNAMQWDAGGNLWFGTNLNVTSVPLPYLLCPSDPLMGGPFLELSYAVGGQKHARNNYMGMFNGRQLSDICSINQRVWAFFGGGRATRIADISDGTSNTVAITEGLTGAAVTDARGFAWSDQACGAIVHTDLGPNSPLPDRCFPYAGWCDSVPNIDPVRPWTQGDGSTTDTCAARSMHPGGVGALLADGSCRFVNDSIDISTWRALGTIAGGEVVGDY
jgi:hypothetical protein